MKTYNERSAVRIRVRLEDEVTGEPVIPTTLHWELYNDSACSTVQGATEITPVQELDEFENLVAVTAAVLVPGPLNVISNDSASKELFRVMVIADKDMDSEFSEAHTYYVRNWKGRR